MEKHSAILIGVSIIRGTINGNPVKVIKGDITQLAVDAYVVPQFKDRASFGGVGGAIARAGGADGLHDFNRIVFQKGELNPGQALITRAGGGHSERLIHVASVDPLGESQEFELARTSVYNALVVAGQHGVTSVAIPALGTGIIGDLTARQSATAMMSAIDRYTREGNPKIDLSFVIFGDEGAVADFASVLNTVAYRDPDVERGEKPLDIGQWERGAEEGIETAKRFGIFGAQLD